MDKKVERAHFPSHIQRIRAADWLIAVLLHGLNLWNNHKQLQEPWTYPGWIFWRGERLPTRARKLRTVRIRSEMLCGTLEDSYTSKCKGLARLDSTMKKSPCVALVHVYFALFWPGQRDNIACDPLLS